MKPIITVIIFNNINLFVCTTEFEQLRKYLDKPNILKYLQEGTFTKQVILTNQEMEIPKNMKWIIIKNRSHFKNNQYIGVRNIELLVIVIKM